MAATRDEAGDPAAHSNSDENIHGERRGMFREAWLVSKGLLPLVLVVIALIGSVVVPARQTWLITKLLRQTTDLVAPARVLAAELQSGLAEETGLVRGYALSRDSVLLERRQATAAADDQRLAALDNLAARLDTRVAEHLAALRERVAEFRGSAALLVRSQGPADLRGAVRDAQARHDATMAAMTALSSDLVSIALARDQRVDDLERVSLLWNTVLVLAALVALCGVAFLTMRERRLAASLQRRVEQESARARRESALREAAEALAGAFTIDEVTERIVHAALDAVGGRGAFVERIERSSDQPGETATVSAVAGAGVPPLGRSREFMGSSAERALSQGLPVVVTGDDGDDSLMPAEQLGGAAGTASTAIVVPLGADRQFVGALSILSARAHVRAEDVARAAIFGHLAALAYEKVRLLDDANEGRRRLERVIASRSRLIRGFSHDVKNPIGAADGYAQLLDDGVYGDLAPQQRESIGRMRRCMRTALSLIDDLHELARAETGHLALSPAPVDLAELVADIAEEFQGAARASQLAFDAVVDAGIPIIQTSRLRVRQIVANLLSNAIKYTDAGSVILRASRRNTGPSGDTGGWIALEVSDTGRGIAPDKLDFIFEEFGRIGDSGATGAGLGLAISRLLAQALGGQITVASEPRHGSKFTLWLPVIC